MALVRPASPSRPARRATTPSAGVLLGGESLLDLVGVASEGIVGLQHREPALIIVSITITGDAMCRATDKTYRLDTPSAREFLDDFVTLP